ELNSPFNLSAGDAHRLDVLGGVRFLNLNERLDVGDAVTISRSAVEGPGSRLLSRDDFRTANQFYGPQAGLRGVWGSDQWLLAVQGKLALGLVHQAADVEGNTVTAGTGTKASSFSGGLLAQPADLGHYARDRFAVLPEAEVKVGYRLTPWLWATVGYDFLYL